jgi:hypothetical protein
MVNEVDLLTAGIPKMTSRTLYDACAVVIDFLLFYQNRGLRILQIRVLFLADGLPFDSKSMSIMTTKRSPVRLPKASI